MVWLQGRHFRSTGKSGQPPRLVVISDSIEEGDYRNGFILADGVAIECDCDGIVGMLLQLLYCYYTWSLSYPKPYQILGFFQEYVLKDTKTGFYKSTNYKNFEKQFEIHVAQQSGNSVA